MGQEMGAVTAEDRTGDDGSPARWDQIAGTEWPWSKLSASAPLAGTGFYPLFLPKASEPRESPGGAASHGDLHLKCHLGASQALHRLD